MMEGYKKDSTLLEDAAILISGVAKECPANVSPSALSTFHSELCDKARKLMLAKSHDYSSGGDHFRNFRGASKLGIDPVKGVLLRIQDKLERINTFVDEGTLSVKEESCLDSVLDIVNYIIIAQMLINERLDDVEYHKAQEEEAKKEQIAPQGE